MPERLKRLDGWSWFAMALAFALQTSTALTSILTSGVLLWALSHPRACGAAWRSLRTEPVFRAMLFLGIVVLVGIPLALLHGYSPWETTGKHIIFLYYFLALGLFQAPERRWAALVGFGLGALLALSTSLFVAASGVSFLNATAGDFNTFRNHTEHNTFLGLATFALATLLLRRHGRPWLGWLAIWLAVFDIYHLVRGRTGQIVFTAMLGYVVAEALWRRRRLVAAITVVVGALSVFPPIAGQPSAVEAGIQAIKDDVASYAKGHAETSVGFRMDFLGTTLGMIREHPLIGVGTGGFSPAYADFVQRHHLDQEATHNPHNDYLFFWAENGLAGLLGVVALYLAMGLTAWRARGLQGIWMGMLALTWAVSGLANSVLLDHASGFVFATLLAILTAGPAPFPGTDGGHDRKAA